MNDSVLTELKVVVERAVRPVRAGMSRKRRMREELLDHLTAICEEEFERTADEKAALVQAKERFGDPNSLAEGLQRSVPAWDRILALNEKTRFEPGESLLHFAGKYVLFAGALFAGTLPLMLLVLLVRGRLAEIGLAVHVVVVIAIVSTALGSVFALFADRMSRALFGKREERSLRKAILYAMASLPVFPATTLLTHLGLFNGLSSSMFYLGLACCFAPAAPVLFLLVARQMADDMQHDEEWACLEIDE
jgi:ATP-dependent Clp protease ATP-binding subunit ClpC